MFPPGHFMRPGSAGNLTGGQNRASTGELNACVAIETKKLQGRRIQNPQLPPAICNGYGVMSVFSCKGLFLMGQLSKSRSGSIFTRNGHV